MSKMWTIAIDFDGTLVENRYPKIEKSILFAFKTLKMLQEEGHRLILWTYRRGRTLEDAVDFCKKKDIGSYAVSKSFPEEQYEPEAGRKILPDVFIDNGNFNGLLQWGES